jgi:Plasmid pRiA4b ORF-3-like protein
MKEFKLTGDLEQVLRDQIITEDQPGTILRDFRTLLDFVGPEGLEAGGKHHLLPMKFIGELDLRLSRPLRLELKRPQLRSHPYLQGLYLLLRASGLSRIVGAGTKSRLVLDPEMLGQWDRLNPTEQYFNLMEAWLRFGTGEMVGESGPSWGLFPSSLEFWKSCPKKGLRFVAEKSEGAYLPGVGRYLYLLALMDLFGLVNVTLPSRPVATWSPAGVKPVPYGDAIFTLIADEWLIFPEREEFLEEADEEAGATEGPRYGAWQRLLQPFFPEWRENLVFPALEPRKGVFIFRVSVGQVWRLIAIPSEATLDDLVAWILRSVEFDDDHLYEISYRDRRGAEVVANHPGIDEGPWADEISIGSLPLEPGQTMQLWYDFGDDWRFTIKLERVEPSDAKARSKKPRILESHGEAPEQYPDWDE